MSLKQIRKSVIITGYGCNNNCIFCMNQKKRNSYKERSTEEILREMVRAKKRGNNYLELIGGETTTRLDIVKLIEFAKELKFLTIMIATNGRMFSYKEFVRKIIKAGLNSIVFSIHGHTPKLHDSLTQVPGSFNQLKTGVQNIKEVIKELELKNINLGSNTTIVKQNYKQLPKIGQFIYNLGLKNAEFIFIDPIKEDTYADFHKIVPHISQITPYVHHCLDIGKKYNIRHWHIRYVPLCYFQNYLNRISEISEAKHFQTIEHLAPDFYDPEVIKGRRTIGRIKPKKCKGCKLYNKCEGIWKGYLKYYGDKELKPVL